jgi:hypothetical protein
MSTPIFIDEPLIVPVTPGEVLVRSSQVLGALFAANSPHAAALQAARQELLAALEKGTPITRANALEAAQQQLLAIYNATKEDISTLAALGFPAPAEIEDEMNIGTVDVQNISVTHTIVGKQVHTSLAFPRAANAKFYWLHEVRYFAANPEERVEDPVLESHFPLFERVRMAPGKRILRIKARNLSTSAISEEFTIEVPQP